MKRHKTTLWLPSRHVTEGALITRMHVTVHQSHNNNWSQWWHTCYIHHSPDNGGVFYIHPAVHWSLLIQFQSELHGRVAASVAPQAFWSFTFIITAHATRPTGQAKYMDTESTSRSCKVMSIQPQRDMGKWIKLVMVCAQSLFVQISPRQINFRFVRNKSELLMDLCSWG